MKKLLAILLFMCASIVYSQDYNYLKEVEIDTKVTEAGVTLDFHAIFIANIVVSDAEGGILEHFVNYKTSKDLEVKLTQYGVGTYYIYIQLADKVAIKRVRVKEKKPFVSYTEQYKIIIK